MQNRGVCNTYLWEYWLTKKYICFLCVPSPRAYLCIWCLCLWFWTKDNDPSLGGRKLSWEVLKVQEDNQEL